MALLLLAVCAGCAGQGSLAVPSGFSSSDAPPTGLAEVHAPPAAASLGTPTQLAGATSPSDFASLLDPPSRAAPAAARQFGVWGIISAQGYPLGDKVAPNGVEYTPILSINMHTNLWLWPEEGLYAFTDAVFWGQKAAPGITNASQGPFDFSKRQFDLNGGLAWNYTGRWEARAFAYSFNNLNRGESLTAPTGYSDGVGVENRYYLGEEYDRLGTPGFDVARASFISLGYYPTKQLIDNKGDPFKPGPFARGYFTYDLYGPEVYGYLDTTLIGNRAAKPKLLEIDGGVAVRPFLAAPRWELRVGGAYTWDFEGRDLEREIYFAMRFIY